MAYLGKINVFNMEREMENSKATGIRNEALAKEKKEEQRGSDKQFLIKYGFSILFLFLFFLSADLRQNSYKILSKQLEKC